MSEIVRAFKISGKVQGVYFRHSTRIEAEKLGLKGVARNLADGSVEVFAKGDARAVAALHKWLQHGPAQARVDAVHEIEVEPAALDLPPGFQVR